WFRLPVIHAKPTRPMPSIIRDEGSSTVGNAAKSLEGVHAGSVVQSWPVGGGTLELGKVPSGLVLTVFDAVGVMPREASSARKSAGRVAEGSSELFEAHKMWAALLMLT